MERRIAEAQLAADLLDADTQLSLIGCETLQSCGQTPEAIQVYARLIVAPVRNAMGEATAAMHRTG